MPNPRDVTLDIVGHDQTEKATRSAADNLDKLARKAKEVDKANRTLGQKGAAHLRRLSDSLRDAATKMDRLGRKAGDVDDANYTLGRRAAGHLRRMSRSLDDAADEADRLKRKINDVDKATWSLEQSAKRSLKSVGQAFTGAAKNIRTAWEVAIIPVIIAALAALPAAATAAGMGIVLGLGGGLAALGIKFGAQNKEVKKSFTSLRDHVIKTLDQISAVFAPVLVDISDDMRDTFDSFAPELKKAFDKLAPVVGRFSDDLFDALDKLKPAIGPVVAAFETLADTLGDEMPGLLESVAKSFTDIAEAIGDNPQSIKEVVDGLGEIIEGCGKVIAWLIRVNATIDSSEAGFDTLGWAGVVAFATIAAKAHDAVADILESFSRIPGPAGEAFRKVAASARAASDSIQAKLDNIKTNKAQAEIRAAEARLRVLGNMKPTPEVTAETEELKRKIKEAQGVINRLHGKPVVIEYRSVGYGKATRGPDGKVIPPNYAGGVGFALTAPGGGSSRTGGPAMPDINATTYVTIDGEAIRSIARTVVDQASGRQAHRARVGRR